MFSIGGGKHHVPGEDAEEPLGHVEDGLNALLLEVSVHAGRHLPDI